MTNQMILQGFGTEQQCTVPVLAFFGGFLK